MLTAATPSFRRRRHRPHARQRLAEPVLVRCGVDLVEDEFSAQNGLFPCVLQTFSGLELGHDLFGEQFE